MKSQFRARLLAVLLTAAFVTVPMTMQLHAEDVDTLKQQQAQYAQQQAENNEKLEDLREQKSEQAAYISSLQSQLSQYETQINDYNNQILDLNLQITQAENQIDELQTQIDADNEKLKQRLRALYMAGEASNLEVLLSADNLVDLADKTEALRMVTQHDTALIDRVKGEQADLQSQKDKIVENREKVEQAKEALDAKEAELEPQLEEAQAFLQQVTQQETDLQSENASIDVEIAKTAAALSEWQSKQEEQQAAAQETGSASTGSSGGSSSQQSPSGENSSQESGSSQGGSSSGHSSNGGSSSHSSNSSTPSGGSSNSFASVISRAEQYLGVPYVFGGMSPSGFDCSGFVCYVLGIGRSTAQGLYNACTPISVSQAQPGDLVFFTGTYNSGTTVTHVGIYAGSGMMIHAGGTQVQYSSINTSYYQQHFYSFGRL